MDSKQALYSMKIAEQNSNLLMAVICQNVSEATEMDKIFIVVAQGMVSLMSRLQWNYHPTILILYIFSLSHGDNIYCLGFF